MSWSEQDAKITHEAYKMGCRAGADAALKPIKLALDWMEERARNSTSFGSHCHAYEVAARHLKLALDGDDIGEPHE